MINRSAMPLALFLVIMCVAGAVVSFLVLNVFADLKGGDPFEHDEEYLLTGTYNGTTVTGTAGCETIDESGLEHFYVFSYALKYGTDSEFDLESVLFCNSKGIPTGMFEKLPETIGDHGLWRYTYEGITYTYEIGDHCKVYSVRICSAELDVTAELP